MSVVRFFPAIEPRLLLVTVVAIAGGQLLAQSTYYVDALKGGGGHCLNGEPN